MKLLPLLAVGLSLSLAACGRAQGLRETQDRKELLARREHKAFRALPVFKVLPVLKTPKDLRDPPVRRVIRAKLQP